MIPYMHPGHTPEVRFKPAPLLRPFMPELDTLRGIAVLGVMCLHAFFWQYASFSFGYWGRFILNITRPGWVGVNLFFVLSGFLITGILLDSRSRPDYYRRFYTRRALRILPAYYLLLLCLLLLRSSSPAFVGLSFIYLSNVTNFFGVSCDYGPLWSLAVEEHFYILWPTVVHKITPRTLAWISGWIALGIPLARAISFSLGWKNGLDWYTWFAADGLAAGSLLAILLRTAVSRVQIRNLAGSLIGIALFLAIAGQPFGITGRARLLGAAFQWTLLNLFFAGVLLLFLLLGTGPRKRYVNLRPLQFLGYISYGLYLDHLLAFRMYDRICKHFAPQWIPTNGHFNLVMLRFAIAGGGAIVAAYLSRRFFEERFLRLKDSLVPRRAETSTDAPFAEVTGADGRVA
jgi:peptidoglycan/LPS O-acetylase OafA/YrhL